MIATRGTSYLKKHLPSTHPKNGWNQWMSENASKSPHHQSPRQNKEQKEKRWEIQEEKRNTFENLLMVLTKTLEDVIDPAFHTGIRGLATRGLGNTKPYDVLSHIHSLYGKPSLTELEGALLRLNKPMNQINPIEVMLQGIEEVQIFLLSNPEEYRQLSEPNLIGYALIKLSKCGGMYAKALERWNKVLPKNRKMGHFHKHMINEYELKIT